MPTLQLSKTNGFDCAACGHEQIAVETGNQASCPNCHRSYLLVVRDEFAMMKADGWVTSIAFGAVDDQPMTVANG